MKRNRLIFPVILLILASLACNIGGQPDPTPIPPTPTKSAEPTEAVKEEPTDTPEPAEEIVEPEVTDPLLVTTLEDVKLATVQIEAEGSFVDPQVGLQLNVAGTGSGFIVDESGIAVTNNHVVTGAALLRVWIGGEDEARNARILGVSECSDLAVIDIEGDGYHYLNWYEEPIKVGLDVYAAGFPLGDPEFTLTRGIVSKERADGQTDWTSVGYVIEHDATINPGNSGGPLVSDEGLAVGVNYASSPSYDQYFAIARDEALEVIDQLRSGNDVASIGINGTAIYDDQGLTGIWVASVESGSPAEKAGLLGGDIVTQMEGLTLAPDGTMGNYCEILRSHGADETLSMQVLRYDTQEVLEGQINGRPLEQSFSFAQELGEEVDDGTTATEYSEYVQVTDDTGSISVEVPREWSDIDGSVWEDEGEVLGAAIVASSDVDAYNESYAVPGVIFLASEQLVQMGDAADLLDLFEFGEDCSFEGRFDYEDALYAGYYDFYSYCDGNDMALVVVAALPDDQAFASLLVVQAISDADLDAIDHILDTFVVVGELPDSQDGGAQMGETSLTVTNLTDDSIWYIYVSPSGADEWGEDWLGGDVLMSGDSYYFELEEGEYDLAAADSEGIIIVERYNEHISGDEEWTLYNEEDWAEHEYVDVRLVNNSGYDICFVYITPSDSEEWGDDWLGEDQVIPDNDSFTFQAPAGYGPYDMQALDCDGYLLGEEYNVEMDGNKVWTINP